MRYFLLQPTDTRGWNKILETGFWSIRLKTHKPFLSIAARRLERIIKEVLDEFGEDQDTLAKLLTGPRVQLAEELSKYCHSAMFTLFCLPVIRVWLIVDEEWKFLSSICNFLCFAEELINPVKFYEE